MKANIKKKHFYHTFKQQQTKAITIKKGKQNQLL